MPIAQTFRLRSCVSVPPSFARLRACQLDAAAPRLVSPALPTQPLRRGLKTRALTTQSGWKDSGPTPPPAPPVLQGALWQPRTCLPALDFSRRAPRAARSGLCPLLAASLLPIGRGRAGPSNGTRRWCEEAPPSSGRWAPALVSGHQR